MLDRRFTQFRKPALSITLAEALLLKVDCEERIERLRRRLIVCAIVQKGTDPCEDPETLLADLQGIFEILEDLSKRINKTYAETLLEDNLTLAEAIAFKDILCLKLKTYESLVETASSNPNLSGVSSVIWISTVNVSNLYYQIEQMARDYSNLERKIQQVSWNTQLLL